MTLGAGTREASEAAGAVCGNAAANDVANPAAGAVDGLALRGSVLGGVPGCLEASKRGLPKSPEPTGRVTAEETDCADGETDRAREPGDSGDSSWYGITGGAWEFP